MTTDTRARLTTAAQWVVAVPFLLAGLELVVLGPGAGAVLLTELTFRRGGAVAQNVLVVVLMALTVAGVWWAFAGRRLQGVVRLGRFAAVVRTSSVAVFAVATFASLTAVLYRDGVVGRAGPRIPDDRLIDRTSELYAWHLVDSVPLLDVTGNLGWEKPVEFDGSLAGLLVVCFTGIVILPLVAAVRLILEGGRRSYGSAVLRALRKGLSGWHVGSPREGRCVLVDPDSRVVVVEAAEAVWNEDPPLRRFRGQLERRELGGAGYVLAVGAIAERARDRLETAFAECALPATLVVWERDEPGDALADAVRGITQRLAEASPAPAEAPAAEATPA